LPSELTSRSLAGSLGSAAGSISREHQAALDDFTEKWTKREISDAEAYLARLGQVAPSLAVELIYREYCLAELAGSQPDPAVFLDRFPAHREMLERLFSVHRACSSAQLEHWIEPTAGAVVFPEAGDEIGPYLLRRELGRGAFARVFLAEQGDLENRLVILKLSTRPTREPWLLARARHSHIVEILSHAVVDDGAFQLICMPFLGGATLSAVLDHRRRFRRPRGSRGDLLKDLDAVAAAEYSGVNPARPAREILNSLTDCQAMAWITARLADALDHAQCRDVIHGDVKPSNILLTADGNPMLLDFNLARKWAFDKTNGPLEDQGGTLDYMAPERLASLASGGSTALDSWRSSEVEPSEGGDPHRADIYSLGIVLLGALTAASPAEVIRDRDAPARAAQTLRDLAAEYGSFRERGALAVIRASESAAGQTIPPALRAILKRCLAVRPAGRYRRALELAEDLDRWRADLPLAYAAEPFWAQTLPRCARRSKKLLFAGGLALVMCLVTTYVVTTRIQSHLTLQDVAMHKLDRNWDDIESPPFQFPRLFQLASLLSGPLHDIEFPAYRFQRPPSPRPQNPDAPETLATATHALKEYGIIGRGDWRQRAEVRNLPEGDRNDLVLWLMEQTFRYCRALEDRPASPGDWRRAIETLDRVSTTPPLQAFVTLRRRLHSRLGQSGTHDSQAQELIALTPEPEAGPKSVARRPPEPPWLEDYLLGVAAELERDPDPKEALRHYDRVLAHSPDSFWGHYRAAVVSFQLEQWSEAARHLDCCLKRRPDNAALHGQHVACLLKLGLLDDALQECTRALESAPDHAEFYRSRAWIRASRGQTEGLVDDFRRFELLSRFLTRGFFRNPPGQGEGSPLPATVPASQRALDLDFNPGFTAQPGDPLVKPEEIKPDELDARTALALSIITKAGTIMPRDEAAETDLTTPGAPASTSDSLAIAADELDKILTLDPQHTTARMARLLMSLEQGRFQEVTNDLDLVLNRPVLIVYLRKDPDRFMFLCRIAERFVRHGLIDEALRIADMAVSCSIELKQSQGLTHYYKAMVLSVAARSDWTQVADAAKHLQLAFAANDKFKVWYQRDKHFDPVRTRINAELDQLPELSRND
jgi:serine/threonine protein kinase